MTMAFRTDETIRYDQEAGEVQVSIDGVIRETIRVRATLVDDLVRAAVILELEKRGYTVIRP